MAEAAIVVAELGPGAAVVTLGHVMMNTGMDNTSQPIVMRYHGTIG